jgi:hypothetical protein
VRGGVCPEPGRPRRAPDRREGHRGAGEPAAPRGDGGGSGHGRRRGLLIQIPDGFFREEAKRLGFALPERGPVRGGGAVPAAGRPAELADTKAGLQRILLEEGLTRWAGARCRWIRRRWAKRRAPPCRRSGRCSRRIPKGKLAGDALERKLLVVRKRAEHELGSQGGGQLAERLCVELLVPHVGLQGHDDRPAGAEVLSGPDGHPHGERAGGGAPALFDQHVPLVAAGPAVPPAGAQRRNQHAARQPQRHGRARAAT